MTIKAKGQNMIALGEESPDPRAGDEEIEAPDALSGDPIVGMMTIRTRHHQKAPVRSQALALTPTMITAGAAKETVAAGEVEAPVGREVARIRDATEAAQDPQG